MADKTTEVGTRLTYDISDFETGINKQIALTEKAQNASESLKKKVAESKSAQVDAIEKVVEAEKKAINSAKSTIQEQDKLANSTKKLSSEKIKLLKQYSKEKAALKQAINDYQIFGTSIGQTKDLFRQTINVSKTFIKVLGRVKIALIATGIGAFAVALGGVIAYLTKTQSGIDKVTKVTTQLGAAVKVIIDRFANLGKNLLNGKFFEKIGENITRYFRNPIKAMREDLKGVKDGIVDVTNEIIKETSEAGKLEDQRIRLREREREIRKEIALQRAEIKQLNLIAEDTTKGYGERYEAIKLAGELENQLLDKRTELAQQELKYIQDKNALSENLVEDLEAEAEAEIKLNNIKEESLELQTTINNKLNTIVAERIRQQEALAQSFAAISNEFAEMLGSFEQLSEEEIFSNAKDSALKNLEELRQASKETAEELGIDTTDIEKAYEILFDKFSNRQLLTDVEGISTEIDTFEVEPREVKVDIKPETIEKSKATIEDSFAIIKDQILTTIGIDQDDAKYILEGLEIALNEALNFISANIDKRIEENERYLDALEQEETRLKDQLAREQELKDRGAANDVERLKNQLKDQENLQREAFLKSEQLKKQQARVQLAQDLAQAGQNLLTAASGIMSAHSSIPFAGIPIALAFIGSMFAAFAKFRSQAKSTVKLFKGAKNIGQFIHKGGQDDAHAEGYHVTDQFGNDTGVRIGGNEMLMPQRAALQHEDGLMKLAKKPEDYSIISNYQKSLFALNTMSESSKSYNYFKDLKSEIKQQTREIVKAIFDKPVAYVISEDSEKVVLLKGKNKDVFEI